MISYGLWTLFAKEVRRFLRVPGQTLLSPVVTTVLYFVVFGWSLGGRLRDVEGVPYARFIVPGLVALGVVTNAYSNTASSLFVMKLQGTVVDLLVSPLSYGEILAAFVGGRRGARARRRRRHVDSWPAPSRASASRTRSSRSASSCSRRSSSPRSGS